MSKTQTLTRKKQTANSNESKKVIGFGMCLVLWVGVGVVSAFHLLNAGSVIAFVWAWIATFVPPIFAFNTWFN